MWVGDSPPPAAWGPAPSSTAARSLSSSSRSRCFPSSTQFQAHPNKVPNQPCLASPSFSEEGLDLLQALLSLPPGGSPPWKHPSETFAQAAGPLLLLLTPSSTPWFSWRARCPLPSPPRMKSRSLQLCPSSCPGAPSAPFSTTLPFVPGYLPFKACHRVSSAVLRGPQG